MFALSSEIRFHHYSQATDMRKSFYGYIGIAQNILGRNPCNDDVLIFIKKRRIKIKLRWDNLMTGTMDGSLGQITTLPKITSDSLCWDKIIICLPVCREGPKGSPYFIPSLVLEKRMVSNRLNGSKKF